MPVRNPLKSAGKPCYGVPTTKKEEIADLAWCDSGIERDYAHLLNYDPNVKSYEEQPCKIRYIFEQKERFYTPDFAVYWNHQLPSLVECKPASKLEDPENLCKWTAARLWGKQHNYTFMLVTDVALGRCRQLLTNIKQMTVHTHQKITPQAKDYLLKAVQSEKRPLSMAELVEKTPLLDPRLTRSYTLLLLYTGELFTDLTKPLNVMTTMISFSEHERK